MFEVLENAPLLRLMEELSSFNKGDDENIINFVSRAKMVQDEMAILDNPVDDNTLTLSVFSGNLFRARDAQDGPGEHGSQIGHFGRDS